jgi:nucleotide-binding universal stress UspA family protein
MFRRIVAAFDGSPGAWQALHQAVLLAREHDALLYALTVEEPVPHYREAADEARAEENEVAAYFTRVLADARQAAASQSVELQTEAVHGHAAQAIVEYASQVGADLIVIGQHGHSGVLERLLGSTSDRVVDTARCSVLVVRDPGASI